MKNNSKLRHVLRAAVGMAAAYFRLDEINGRQVITRDQVALALDGHIEAWGSWEKLSYDERRRFGRLIGMRNNRLADAAVTCRLLDEVLAVEGQDDLPGCTPAADYTDSGEIHVELAMPPLDFVDGCLATLDDLTRKSKRCLPVAEPGTYHSVLRVPHQGGHIEVVDATYDIQPHHIPAPPPPPPVRDAFDMPSIKVPFRELADIAEELDEQFGTTHRSKAVQRFINEIEGEFDPLTARADRKLELTAGKLNELIAYTGFGKSVVLIETFACWAVDRGLVVTYVLPNNSDVAKYAHIIETAFTETKRTAKSVTPWVSPRSMFTVAKSVTSPPHGWTWHQFGYGCALAAAATTDESVDTWAPGSEPCTTLRAPKKRRVDEDRTVACPFRQSCGRYRLVRAALTADVIVTSHANLHLGMLQFPVDDGLGETDRMSVEELVLRRSHVVVIDEVDDFQRGTISQAGRSLILDEAGKLDTPLRKLDIEFGAAFGRVRAQVDASVRDAFHTIRYLSELYVSHLAYGRIGSPEPGVRRRWTVPGRWDHWLTARLFGLDDEKVEGHQVAMFESLFPGPRFGAQPDEPQHFEQMRPLIEGLTAAGSSGGTVATVRSRLESLLGPQKIEDESGQQEIVAIILDERDRARTIDRIVRRAILERVRFHLHELMSASPQLVNAGIESVQAIADALGTYGRWRFTPTGPLGRLVFAFTEHVDTDDIDDAWLHTAAFGGDPHAYVTGLGEATALAHAGVRRAVLGLSATSYFPLAPHHHVHVQPKWWVCDNSGNVEILASEVQRGDGEAVRISGLDGGARNVAIQELAGLLWRDENGLKNELARLRKEQPDRQRVLLATTSYAAGKHLAKGLVAAGVAPHDICLGVRPASDERTPDEVHVADDTWFTLPANRLDEMPGLNCRILVAPLARVQRGINIIGKDDRSALGSVWLIIRPIPLIDEPEELVAHIQAMAHRRCPDGAEDLAELLRERRGEAGKYFDKIVRSRPYFSSQPPSAKLGVVAEILNGAIQLVGRARRGGTDARLHLVDGAFLNPKRGPNFAALIQQLSAEWTSDEQERMNEIYGSTLRSFLAYADEHSNSQPINPPEEVS
ncbi:hypothetical protein ABZ863_18755 [Saccharomonospora sp. NPDC046836]|uniref:hypothetical protein n=1 Tax=Saccharomonospora sp. NPDC046836 TaxID=3156921 RepID=UPI0033C2BB45